MLLTPAKEAELQRLGWTREILAGRVAFKKQMRHEVYTWAIISYDPIRKLWDGQGPLSLLLEAAAILGVTFGEPGADQESPDDVGPQPQSPSAVASKVLSVLEEQLDKPQEPRSRITVILLTRVGDRVDNRVIEVDAGLGWPGGASQEVLHVGLQIEDEMLSSLNGGPR